MSNTPSALLPFNLSGKIDAEAELAIKSLWKGVSDAHAAIIALVPKVNTGTGAAPATTVSTPTIISGGGGGGTNTGAGSVNQQTGTSYLLQNTDYGALIVIESAVAFALSLNNALTNPFYCVVENFGAGVATMTPISGDVNDLPSIPLESGESCLVFFDGVNFWATTLPPLPQSIVAAVHLWLNSYDETTGLFTAGQPAAADLIDGTTGSGPVVLDSTCSLYSPTVYAPASIRNLQIFSNNASAVAGGLIAGNLYRNGSDPDGVCVVH